MGRGNKRFSCDSQGFVENREMENVRKEHARETNALKRELERAPREYLQSMQNQVLEKEVRDFCIDPVLERKQRFKAAGD